MPKRVGACRRVIEQAVRACGEAFSLVAIFVLALAPIAGAIAVTFVLRNWFVATALLAATSLGAFVFGQLRTAPEGTAERAAVVPLDQKDTEELPGNASPPPARGTSELVGFHDFNSAQNRFEHW